MSFSPEVGVAMAAMPHTILDRRFQAARSLSEISFEDIYIGPDGAFMVEVSLSNDGSSENHEIPPLVGIPKGVQEDTRNLYKAALELEKVKGLDKNLGGALAYDSRRYRIQKMPTMNGDWYNFRWVRVPPQFSSIKGISNAMRKTFRYLASNGRGQLRGSPVRNGLLLVTGGTGGGKTTLMT
mgnify:CR=1 FL=1